MKKLRVLMAIVLMLVVAAPVFAANLTQDTTTGTMNVTYGVGETYTISIPDSLGFTQDLTQTVDVSVTDVLLPHGKTLTLSLTSANDYKLVYEDSEIVYTVTKGSVAFTSQVTEVLTVSAGDPEATTTESLTFATTSEAIAAATLSGQHVDTLTFTASVN
jgi:uncharacterized cupin superfamily protein